MRLIQEKIKSEPGFNPRVLAICGGGNAGHALAVVASQTFDGPIHWLVGSKEKEAALKRNGASEGLEATGAIETRTKKRLLISSDPAEVIPRADLVMLVVPAFAHASILKRIGPYLGASAVVGSVPARGGFEYEASALIAGIQPVGRRVVFGLQTLPWSTRVQQAGRHVNFGAIKATVLMATMPAERAPAIAAVLSQIFGIPIAP